MTDLVREVLYSGEQLRKIDRPSLHVDMLRLEDGSLQFVGQDLDYPLADDEDREYEYWITIPPDQLGTVCHALGQPSDCDPISALKASGGMLPDGRLLVAVGEYTWAKEIGVKFDFANFH